MSIKDHPSRRGAKTARPKQSPIKRSGSRGQKWLKYTAAALAAVGALDGAMIISQPQQPAILRQKCGGICHSVAKLRALNLPAAAAAVWVDKMVSEGKTKLTAQERAEVIAAVSLR